ncbi:phosphotransferase [Palleronia caenipelagi]|uniref:Aminoglycoside phosphotransferase domain-containing protein n=1 Tax=Palleronia caenipelagi TaxID=2489174 RepID=A0A547PPE2_9RHOB|nr:phosphotransferase [Palleronia caenipelagi]TRD16007.1 hypothetical protein FEV53_14865 [Palleronia caenipelagi]
MINDPNLPALGDLSGDALERMTGRKDLRLLRLRYRKGQRAILHVGSPEGEGVVWLFAGGKGRRIARRNPSAYFDPESGAVFEDFPNDHRLPEIAALIREWPEVAPQLIGGPAVGGLDLLRYRPGLSATLRCVRADGRVAYVKVIRGEDVTAIATANRRQVGQLTGTKLEIAPVLGTAPALRAIAFASAKGVPLDQLLREAKGLAQLGTVLDRLASLQRQPAVSTRVKDATHLHQTAREAAEVICTVFPDLSDLTFRLLAKLDTLPRPEGSTQIHGDIKLEHIFTDGDRVTLIDTETMALGPADYDPAMLSGRIRMAEAEARIAPQVAAKARSRIAQRAGPWFEWCAVVVGLRLARYYAQHPEARSFARASDLMRREVVAGFRTGC